MTRDRAGDDVGEKLLDYARTASARGARGLT